MEIITVLERGDQKHYEWEFVDFYRHDIKFGIWGNGAKLVIMNILF